MAQCLPPSQSSTSQSSSPHAAVKATALYVWTAKYQGFLETKGENRGPVIDKWNRAVGAPPGSAHCASSVSAGLRETGALSPVQQTAWARAFAQNVGIDARDVFYGRVILPDAAYVASFVRNGGGHAGFTFWQEAGKLFMWESNTTPPSGLGSQWNGEYTGWKTRSVKSSCSPWNAFRIVKFVPVIPRPPSHATYTPSPVVRWMAATLNLLKVYLYG